MKTITINNVRFVIQAFDKDKFFNLSAIDNGDVPFDKKLGCLQFDLRQKKNIIFHTGKDNTYSLDFISKINIQEVSSEVHAVCEK
jgi:hypothetical protein